MKVESVTKTRSQSMTVALLCGAAVSAQFVGGRATRDALFLTSLAFTALPTVLIATSACSLLLVAAQARWAGRVRPTVLVPAAFAVSGVLFIGEWLTRAVAPAGTAVLAYLHISGAGPLLASGFWLIASERFDPHSAKAGFGRITGAGTLGGLVGALLAERVAATQGVPTMLLVLAALQFLTAWLVWVFARQGEVLALQPTSEPLPVASVPLRHGLRVVADTPQLRHLAALVLLGTTGAALVEYLFKVQAVETFGPGDHLLRFFALYYAGASVVTFLLQAFSSRAVLDRFGLALTTSTPSIALLAGSLGSLVAPGFGGLVVARAGESVFRGSWFRAGYELFYTPMPVAEKRSAKSVIDVAFDRLGDAVGGGLVRVAMVFGPASQSTTILSLAALTSAGAILAASTLNRWYLRALEHSLLERRGQVDGLDQRQDSIRTALLGNQSVLSAARTALTGTVSNPTIATFADPDARDIEWLRSGHRRRILRVLSREEGLSPALVPHAIPLLARDDVAGAAVVALRKVAAAHVDSLGEALLDRDRDHVIRRRIARVLAGSASQPAADVLLGALDADRFDVRLQAARALLTITGRNPQIALDPERVTEVVLREVAVSRPVWEGRQLLQDGEDDSPLNVLVRDRASQSLAHVFTVLSLVLPKEPLQVAFRSLQSGDAHLRGTALEYLESILPPRVRERLWPFLVEAVRANRPQPWRDEDVASLLRSSGSRTLQALAGGPAGKAIAGVGTA
jgi:hypothetical protein